MTPRSIRRSRAGAWLGRSSAGTLRYDTALPTRSLQTASNQLACASTCNSSPSSARRCPSSPLDTGAGFSVVGCAISEQAGWSPEEIAGRALDVRAIYGFGRRGPPVRSFVRGVTCHIAFGAQFAPLRCWAAITPPNKLTSSVSGRADLFEQLDLTFANFKKMLYLRYRNPAVGRLF